MKNQYIPSLNGLRAICICMVIGAHLLLQGFIPRTPIHKMLAVVLYNGGLGVGFFFVISGFLITGLLIKENEKYGTISLKSFYMRRSLRIFPAYYLLVAVYFLLQSIGYLHLSTSNWVSMLTYTTQFTKHTPVEIAHLWSLSVEELFYLIWPLLFILFFRKGNLYYLYGGILLFPFLRFINYSYPTYHCANTIFSSGDALLIGCLTAIHYQQIRKWVIDHSKLILLAFPLLAFFTFSELYTYHLISLNEHTTRQAILLNYLLPLLNSLFGNKGLFTNILIALIIVYSINVKTYWYKLLNLKMLNYIGVLSYSIYLWQEVLITPKTHSHLSLPLVLLLILISAHISYYLIEKPILLLKDKTNIVDLLKVKIWLRRAH